MVNLLCQLHFWTLKPLAPGIGNDISVHSYHDKSAGEERHVEPEAVRKQWAQGRGIVWTPKNKRPEKLRETLKECEELFSTHPPICMKWKGLRHCLVLLSNGILVTFTVAKHSGDVERVLIDKTLEPRLQAPADNALMVGSGMVLTLSSERRPACVSLSQRRSSFHVPLTLTPSDSGRRLEKLSAQDPKVSFVDVEGMPDDMVRRHIVSSSHGDLVAIWWRDTQDSGWQWSSMADSGLNNILLFTMNSGKLEYCCGVQTDGDPVDVMFSKNRNHVLHTLEKVAPSAYESCIYELEDNQLDKAWSVAKVTSDSNIVVCERNKDETKLLIGCENGTLILHDCLAIKAPETTKVLFSTIVLIRWHPAGSLAFVCGSGGEIQGYDLSLNPVMFQTLSEDPSPTLILQMASAPTRLEMAGWGSEPAGGEGHGGCYDNFVMVFDRGPVVLLRTEFGVLSRGKMGPTELVSEYLRCGKANQAVCVLKNMNWSFQPSECFTCLTLIMDHLLIQPLSANTEDQMESTLAEFTKLSTLPSAKQIYTTYNIHVTNLSRRYFHLLLRYKRLEKAFELANKIGAKDLFMRAVLNSDGKLVRLRTEACRLVEGLELELITTTSYNRVSRLQSCMDIHYMAKDLGEQKLADSAKEGAKKSACSDFVSDVLQAAGLMESVDSKLAAPTRLDSRLAASTTVRTSSLARSQSSRQSRPPPAAVHVHAGSGSILRNGDYDEKTGGVFGRARHTSLLSFDSIRSSYRAVPLMEQATAFESDATPSHSEDEDCVYDSDMDGDNGT